MDTPDITSRAPRAARRRGLRLTLSVATLGLGVALPTTIAAAASSHSTTPLKQGQKYFAGKTMTFVSPDSPGGGFDLWARLLAPELSKYLKATVNVENIPAGNTVAGQDFVAHSQPNGLTIGLMNPGPDVENTVLNLPALNFNPLREAFLGATSPNETAVLVLNTPACAQYTSFDSIVNGSPSAPKIKEVLQTTGTTTFTQLMINSAFGIQYQPITGYQSTTAQLQGFERGDGCLTITNTATAAPLITGGKARALLLTVPIQAGLSTVSTFAGVPTEAQEYAKYSKSVNSTKARASAWQTLVDLTDSTRIFFAPSATTTPERTALIWAFQKAMKDPTLIAAARAEGNPVGEQTAAKAKSVYESTLADAKREVGVLNSVIG